MGVGCSPGAPSGAAVGEAGIDWPLAAWRGLGPPQPRVTQIAAAYEHALADVVRSQEFREFMATNGFGVVWRNAQEFPRFMAEQDRVLGTLLKDLGLAT